MATLTRYSVKSYRDSTETCYVVFISASENPIAKITIPSVKGYSLSIETLSDGSLKHIISFTEQVQQEI